jgi:hypothetical protein
MCRAGSAYGGLVLRSALDQGLWVGGVILQNWDSRSKSRRFRRLAKQHGLLSVVMSKALETVDNLLLAEHDSRDQPLEDVCQRTSTPVFPVPSLNGTDTLSMLDELRPALILLGGVGIVSAEVIDRASLGVLNAHPGIVPDYRGNYVVRWALLAGDPIGITVHLVDTGIDTGMVLSINQVSLQQTRSLVQVEAYMDQLRAQYLATAAREFLDGTIEPVPQHAGQTVSHYSLMPPGELFKTYRALWQRGADRTLG